MAKSMSKIRGKKSKFSINGHSAAQLRQKMNNIKSGKNINFVKNDKNAKAVTNVKSKK